MSWIDQNLDAYRVIAEILTDLRPLVRERLEAKHGKDWFKDGIPETVFDRLINNKEQEASIDWYENRYQEVIDYAVFSDLFEIVMANPGLFQPILKLAPSNSLLSTRFLELEVMRSKIGRARQVSDAEINFLTSFHLRFRKALQELKSAPVDESEDFQHDIELDGEEETAAPEITPTEAVAATADVPLAPDAAEGVGERPAAQTAAGDRPPQRLASPNAREEGQANEDEAPAEAKPKVEEVPAPATAEEESPATRETPSVLVKRAMDTNNVPGVMREIYREVTGIAEVIWTTDEIPTTAIWDRVSTNAWYEANFSKLELRPLSDFYEIISQVRTKRKSGAPKKEVQSFLNGSNFATTLLALRDLFHKHKI